MDDRTVDGQVTHPGDQVVDVQMREVDAVFGVAVLEFFETELHAVDGRIVNRQLEFALFLAVGIAQPLDHLLDVHLAAGRLMQTEFRAAQFGSAQDDSVAEKSETRHEGFGLADIQERIMLEILHIEPFDTNPAEQPDIHPVDGDLRPELLRNQRHGLLDHEILDRRNIEQQREQQREKEQQQNRGREHLSQYFHTFVHRKSFNPQI